MKKYKVIGIIWDCDDDNPDDFNLPKDTEIEAEDEDDVVDVLSDKYGFCIYSVSDIKEIKQ